MAFVSNIISAFPQFHEGLLNYIRCLLVANETGGIKAERRVVFPKYLSEPLL